MSFAIAVDYKLEQWDWLHLLCGSHRLFWRWSWENTKKASAEWRIAANLSVFYRTLLENGNILEKSSCFSGISSTSLSPHFHQKQKWKLSKVWFDCNSKQIWSNLHSDSKVMLSLGPRRCDMFWEKDPLTLLVLVLVLFFFFSFGLVLFFFLKKTHHLSAFISCGEGSSGLSTGKCQFTTYAVL